jgi:hypothetical protein
MDKADSAQWQLERLLEEMVGNAMQLNHLLVTNEQMGKAKLTSSRPSRSTLPFQEKARTRE